MIAHGRRWVGTWQRARGKQRRGQHDRRGELMCQAGGLPEAQGGYQGARQHHVEGARWGTLKGVDARTGSGVNAVK